MDPCRSKRSEGGAEISASGIVAPIRISCEMRSESSRPRHQLRGTLEKLLAGKGRSLDAVQQASPEKVLAPSVLKVTFMASLPIGMYTTGTHEPEVDAIAKPCAPSSDRAGVRADPAIADTPPLNDAWRGIGEAKFNALDQVEPGECDLGGGERNFVEA